MNKMDGMSMDLKAENIAQLKALFPEAVTEGKVDFEVLKALLGGEIEQRQEYYKFTWNGKEAARAYARTRSMGTLRPCVEESSGKDGTAGKFDSDNLYIEGDNLEVLKLLQGPYHKKVRMIYIDPPYNTGKDFVYPDNFRDSLGNYKALTGQTDDDGKSTRANPETSGRYHTDWLNMMYPRLILARNLLTDDGVIFISIDDSEQDNLKKLCDDVLGEENHITTFVVIRSEGGGLAKQAIIGHDLLFVYAKNISNFPPLGKPKDIRGKIVIINGEEYWIETDWFREVFGQYGTCHYEDILKFYNQDKKDEIDAGLQSGQYTLIERNGKHVVGRYRKVADDTTKFYTILKHLNKNGVADLESIDMKAYFDYPKPTSLLKEIIQGATIKSKDRDNIILDFFSGSATTAHAALQLNAEDGGNRKYIMIQLPEVCEAGTEAAKAGYANICEIGKERIRRAAKKIKGEHPDWNGDMGFKVFKLDTSNMLPWNPNADELEQNLFAAVDNVLEGRTTDDLLHEILLKCNLPLTLPIETKQCGSNTIYLVGAGALAICLDKNIPASIAEEIVRLRDEYAPIVPMQVVFRDNGFNDVTKTNALQILKQAGFEEKSIQTI